jgi:hypothetical protein
MSTTDLLIAASAPLIAPAIAGVDEQIAIEQQRIETARAELSDSQRKIEALLQARESLAAIAALYNAGDVPPPPIPTIHTGSGNGKPAAAAAATDGNSTVRRVRRPLADDEVLDAIRGNGGRVTVPELAGIMDRQRSVLDKRLAKLADAGKLQQSKDGPFGANGRPAVVFSIPAPAPGSPELEPGESPVLDAAVRAADTGLPDPAAANGTAERAVARRSSPNLSRLPRREAPEPASAPDKILTVMRGGSLGARWKVRELVQMIARDKLGVYSIDQIGVVADRMAREGVLCHEADWYALPTTRN